MYLFVLNHEVKELFLDIAILLAKADGDFSEREKITIKAYCNEMDIIYRENEMTSDIKSIIAKIDEKSDIREKKIILFEISALAMSDENLDENERDIIVLAAYIFGLDENYINSCIELIKQYKKIQVSINNLVLD